MFLNPRSPVLSFCIVKNNVPTTFLCTQEQSLLERGHALSASLVVINEEKDSSPIIRLRILSRWFTGDVFIPIPVGQSFVVADHSRLTIHFPSKTLSNLKIQIIFSSPSNNILADRFLQTGCTDQSLTVEFQKKEALEDFLIWQSSEEQQKICKCTEVDFEEIVKKILQSDMKQAHKRFSFYDEIRRMDVEHFIDSFKDWEVLVHAQPFMIGRMTDYVLTSLSSPLFPDDPKEQQKYNDSTRHDAELCFVKDCDFTLKYRSHQKG